MLRVQVLIFTRQGKATRRICKKSLQLRDKKPQRSVSRSRLPCKVRDLGHKSHQHTVMSSWASMMRSITQILKILSMLSTSTMTRNWNKCWKAQSLFALTGRTNGYEATNTLTCFTTWTTTRKCLACGKWTRSSIQKISTFNQRVS